MRGFKRVPGLGVSFRTRGRLGRLVAIERKVIDPDDLVVLRTERAILSLRIGTF
jgi:hypothetical protein